MSQPGDLNDSTTSQSPAKHAGDREAYIEAVRSEPATEKQKAKLSWFGCTWDEGITKGQASDAIEECVRSFPEREAEYYRRPATEEQLAKLREFNEHQNANNSGASYCDLDQSLTYKEAKVLIEEWVRDHRHEKGVHESDHQISNEARIRLELSRFNDYWLSAPRDVTREEFVKAWAFVKSQKPNTSDNPSPSELTDALQELFPELHSASQACKKTTPSLSERREILDKRLSELVADGDFTKEDEKVLTALVLELGFTESFTAELLKQKFTQEFLPIKKRMEQTFVMTDSDVTEIERLKRKYDIQLTLEGNADLFRSIYLVEFYGRLPEPIDPPLMLGPSETAYFSIFSNWNQIQGTGGFHKELGSGTLYVTSHRLLFCSYLRNTSIVLKRIVGCTVHSDCVKIIKSSGKTDFFSMNAFNARFIQALIKALK